VETHTEGIVRIWVRVGIGAGFGACVIYPVVTMLPIPRLLAVVLAASFGPALAAASTGLYYFMRVARNTVSAQVAVVSNIIAGAMITAMFLVQLAARVSMTDYLSAHGDDASVRQIVHWVWTVTLGLDVAFDVFVGIGTLFFAIGMVRHPRFGRFIAVPGIVIGLLLLALNLYTFPKPPADAGLFDAGPLMGLWYLIVTIQIVRSRRWMNERLDAGTLA
jgi:hypothetical protein